MLFQKTVGQERIKETLTRSLEKRRIPHALLFHGAEGVGKESMALELAAALICQQDEYFACGECSDCKRISQLSHPDVIYIFPAMKSITPQEHKDIISSIARNPYLRLNPWANPSISIDQIRELKRVSSMTSFENKGRVVIIAEAHHMRTEAANSLLKILEEPPGKMTIILTSSQPNMLLSTIMSRCQALRFGTIGWQEIEQALVERQQVDAEKAQLVAKLSFGSYRRALEMLDEDLDQKRHQVLDILRTVIRSDLDRLMLAEKLVRSEDKKAIKDLLAILLLWFRDALIYSQGNGGTELIVNIDLIETLERFCNSFEDINFEAIVADIESAIDLFNRNVYVNLIVINLFYSLKHNLRRKGHA
ncbi:DNA polymerase III subunit delta' [candidate division KSB1 bacterium]|nr:DNA polymerase III subunit delta' [candidate division KSB1 bacterium]